MCLLDDAVLSGTFTWKSVTTQRTTAQFSLVLTLSNQYYQNKRSGDPISLSGGHISFGDGQTVENIQLIVEEVVNDRGYLIAATSFSHEYSNSLSKVGPWKAYFKYCCRQKHLINNRGTT